MQDVALVTGGARGIGLGTAKALASAGYDLAICGRSDRGSVQSSIDGLLSLGADVLYVSVDISDAAGRRKLIDEISTRFGRLNLLVNNAGVTPRERRDILDATEESFEWVLKVNLQGPYFLTQLAARWMIEQKQANPDYRAAIINITSISSTTASINRGEYCISKAGLSMATKLWAIRLASEDIPVYEVRPGIIRTDMTAAVEEKYTRQIDDGLLLQKRWGDPHDVGKAVVMLARDSLPYSTGQVIMVDGGFSVERL